MQKKLLMTFGTTLVLSFFSYVRRYNYLASCILVLSDTCVQILSTVLVDVLLSFGKLIRTSGVGIA